MILAADIGGTKVDIAIFKQNKNDLKIIHHKQYLTTQYIKLIDILKDFQEKYNPKINKVCFGIAGPVIDNVCTTTNLPWKISKIELEAFYKIKKVTIINDLEATAYGMLHLEENQFITLNPKGIKKNANCAVIAAGTGLGEAQLFFNGTNYHPVGSEGGHTDFAPQNQLEDKLLIWLRERFPKHVSYERILSGSGILTLYQFLCETRKQTPHKDMQNITKENKKSSLITNLAIKNKDPLSIETLEIFSKIYGAEAGNLALKSMSLGGVYIGGGIAPEILPILKNHFMESFVSKGRFKNLLEEVEVKVSLNKKAALLGAAFFAKDKL